MKSGEKVGLVFVGIVAVVSAVLLFVPAIQQAESAGRWTSGLGIPLWVVIAIALLGSLLVLGSWFFNNRGRRK